MTQIHAFHVMCGSDLCGQIKLQITTEPIYIQIIYKRFCTQTKKELVMGYYVYVAE